MELQIIRYQLVEVWCFRPWQSSCKLLWGAVCLRYLFICLWNYVILHNTPLQWSALWSTNMRIRVGMQRFKNIYLNSVGPCCNVIYQNRMFHDIFKRYLAHFWRGIARILRTGRIFSRAAQNQMAGRMRHVFRKRESPDLKYSKIYLIWVNWRRGHPD
jgi:hypothetical protein